MDIDAEKYYKDYKAKKTLKRYSLSLLFVLVCIILSSFLVNKLISPIVKGAVKNKVTNLVIIEVNKLILEYISAEEITYDKLVVVDKANDNTITGLYANMPLINNIKSSLSLEATKSIGNIDKINLVIPIGSLFGEEFFSGSGPKIPFTLEAMGYAKTEINSNFITAGINQTVHSINVTVDAKVGILLKGYRETIDVTVNVPIAQTVIIGKIPNYYFNGQNSQNIPIPQQ